MALQPLHIQIDKNPPTSHILIHDMQQIIPVSVCASDSHR
jgi:hypothetical protein